MTRTIVTGANGLIGYALRQHLKEDVVFLSRSELDLTDFSATRATFLALKPQNIIHLAARVGGIGGNMIHSGEYFRDNIVINTNVLESARLAGVRNLISFMSTCVFPDKCNYPLNERDLHNGPPHPSNFGYAYAKRMLEVQSSAYRREWNCNYIVGIPTNVYGPNDNFSLTEGHVLPALIHKTYLAKEHDTSLSIWGSGKPLREFVYAEDIARLALWAVENYSEDMPIIFTSGIETSIAEVTQLIAEKMGFSGKIVFDASKPDGQFRKPSDSTKLNSYLPDFKWTPLAEGLDKTIEWFCANYPRLRM